MKLNTNSKGAKPEMTISPDEEVVRFFQHREWGSLPVVRKKRVVGVKRVPVLDPETGKQLYRQTKEGAPKTYLFKNEEIIEERELLKVPSRAGHIYYQEHFEPSAETLRERARRSEIDRMSETVFGRLVDAGMNTEALLKKLGVMGAEIQGDAPEAALGDSEPSDEYELKMVGPGRWPMPDGSLFKGNKKGALAHLNSHFPEHGGAG